MHRCSFEENVYVRNPKKIAKFPRYAKADALVTVDFLPHSEIATFEEIDILSDPGTMEYLEQAYYKGMTAYPIKLIVFAQEYKRHNADRNVASRQVAYHLSTAQSQRRSLGLRDQVIFGGVYADSRLTIYSCCWGMVRGISVSYIHPNLLVTS